MNVEPTVTGTRSVFISYNSRDLHIVHLLVRQLEAGGIDVLWDRDDLERKGRWQKELYELIQRAGGALVICGPHGPGDWQQEEIDACVSRTKKKGAEFDLRAVWLPGIEPESFASFLDNYDRVDLRSGIRVELIVARLNGPRRKTAPGPLPGIGAPGSRYGPWPETNEHADGGKAFGNPYQPPKAWLQLDSHTRQRAHLGRHLDDPEVCARWSLEALGAETREALELIHTGGLCAQPDYLAALWPRPWSSLVEELDRGGLILKNGHYLTVEVHVAACLNLDEEAIRVRHEQWIERLLPLADHWDVGLALCLHLFSTQRYPEVVSLMHVHMLSVEEGWVRDTFGTVVDALAKSPKIWRRLKPDERVLLLDTQGLHRLHKGDTDAALETFRSMGRIASRASDQWGMAQSWLHQGLTWFARGDIDQAARCYRRSAECARNGEDDMLRGRALHNLAQCLMDNAPAQAARILEESAECKHRAGDTVGLFATYDARGLLSVHRDDLAEALRWFRRAERVARKSGWRRDLAHGLHNLASTLCDLGRHVEARPLGEEAYALAHELQDPELLVLTTQGLAVRCHRAGDAQRALPLFLELSELKLARRDFAGAVVAQSDAGAVCVQLNDYPGARVHLDQAIRLAREHGALDELLQAFGNYAASYRPIARIDEGLAWLEQAGAEAARRGEWCVLAKLAAIEAGWRDERNEDTADVQACWDRAIAAAAHCRQWPYRLELLQNRYAWLRDRLGFVAALPAAEELVALLARRGQHAKEYVSALNELGNALQEQTRFDEARRRYRQALRALTRVDDPALQAIVLNNLGELSRKTGRVEAAMTLYHQSLAKLPGDALEDRFATEINLALAEAEAGDTKSAEKRLERVRDIAGRKQLWAVNAKAWLVLADITWNTHRHGLALRRYDNAIQSAGRHDLIELRLHAELNRAHLLLERERPADVVTALGPLEASFGRSPYRAELHLALADGYSSCGQTVGALATLSKALAPPSLAEAPIPWLDLHAAFARVLFDSGDPEGAWEAMAQALTLPCPPHYRATLLIKAAELAVAIDRGRDGISQHVQAIVDAAQAEAGWNKRQCRHFWRTLGDTLWQADDWSGATISYIKGMIDGAGDGDAHIEDGIYLFQQLSQLGETRAQVMEEVRSKLAEQAQVDPTTLQRLLWPLAMAERAGDKALTPEEVIRLFHDVWNLKAPLLDPTGSQPRKGWKSTPRSSPSSKRNPIQ